MLNTGISLQRLATKAGVGFTPKKLFSNGEAGVWYDPSDVEASLTWRRNLLEYTEAFDNSAWIKTGTTSVTSNAGVAPNGTQTADRVNNFDDAQGDRLKQTITITNSTLRGSVWVKGEGSNIGKDITLVIKRQGGTYTGSSSTHTLTDSWVRLDGNITQLSDNTGASLVFSSPASNSAESFLVWGAQIEQSSTATEYQPIRTTFDNTFKQAFPKHTLYQNEYGKTPVTGFGQAVGLMLDKSQGLQFGDEEVTNGGFDSASNWTIYDADAASDISNGVAYVESAGSNAYIKQQLTGVTAGKTYIIKFNYINAQSTGLAYVKYAGTDLAPSGFHETGEVSYIFTAGSGSQELRFMTYASDGASFTIDDVSVKEVKGSHATQSDSTKRPVFARHPERGRVNLLKYTEEVDNGAWNLAGTTVTPNATIAPDGTTTADKVIADTGLSQHRVDQTSTSTAGVQTLSAYVKNAGYGYTWMRIGSVGAVVNIDNGVTGFVSTGVTVQSQDAGNGWRRVAITTSAGANEIARINMMPTSATADYSGDGTSGIYIWGAQLEEANEATGYQKVVDDYDITESGYKSVYYLQFDGINDTMAVQPVTSTDAPISVFMGHDTEGNTGTTGYLFDIQDGRLVVAGAGYYHSSWVGASGVDPEAKGVTSIISDGTNADYRRDGLLETTGALPNISIQGAISIFSRMDYTTQFTNGNMYQLVIRGATSTDKEIDQAEEFVAIKTGLKSEVVGLATLDLNFGANTYTARNSNGSVL